MIVLGLTGSIGMGKSTTASFFRQIGVPVFDADRCVHLLYEGEAFAAIAARFPESLVEGRIDRQRLGKAVLADSKAMAELEAIIHPLVARRRKAFLASAKEKRLPLAVVDVPLLFEVGEWRNVDVIAVATASFAVQRTRVLSRPNMTEEKFLGLLNRQLADVEKRRRAHFVIETGHGFASAQRQIRGIVAALRPKGA